MLIDIAVSCSAMYGGIAVSAMTVTMTPMRRERPKRPARKSEMDVAFCCLADQPFEEPQAEHQQDQRPEVARDVEDAVARGRADGAVEGPARPIHREREAVDDRPEPGVLRIQLRAISPPRHREQSAHVEQARKQQHPAGNDRCHRLRIVS
jgi:hypothetical protein